MYCLGYLNRLFFLAIVSTVSMAENNHNNPVTLQYDAHLSLSTLVENTLAKSPDQFWLEALATEVKALRKRSDSWAAGAASIDLGYQEASSGTLHFIDGGVSVPIWHWGQQDAEAQVAHEAAQGFLDQTATFQLQVAGIIRAVLWDYALSEFKLKEAMLAVEFFEQALVAVSKSVQLGELSHLDLLPIKRDLLTQKARLAQIKTDLNKIAKRFQTITYSNVVPYRFDEKCTDSNEINVNHPLLAFINSKIARKKAEYQALVLRGSGQTRLSLGVNSDRGDSRSNDTESFNIALNIPLGSDAHTGPALSVINIELTKLVADRTHLINQLNDNVFDLSQNIALGEAVLVMVKEIVKLESDRLKISERSYQAGELSLYKFKKIQLTQRRAELKVMEQVIINNKNVALYNQSLGVLP